MRVVENRIGFPLETRAITTSDAGTQTREASIEFGSLGPVLRIHGTPGSWYLTTLIGLDSYSGYRLTMPGDRLPIDLGRGWYVENLRALVTEALSLLLGKDGRKLAGVAS